MLLSDTPPKFARYDIPSYSHLTKQAETLIPKFYGIFGLWSSSSAYSQQHHGLADEDRGGGWGQASGNSPSSSSYSSPTSRATRAASASSSWWAEPEMWVVVMQNVFDTPLDIHLKFDLKGSQVNRNVRLEPLNDYDFLRRQPRNSVYKDLDFLGVGPTPSSPISLLRLDSGKQQLMATSCRKVRVGRLMKKIIMQQLQVDTRFLQANGRDSSSGKRVLNDKAEVVAALNRIDGES
eukprot:jgi/Bigna1/139786/aug1.52_g14494